MTGSFRDFVGQPSRSGAQPNLPSRGKILCVFEDATLVRTLEPAIVAAGFTLLRARHGMHGYWMALTGAPELIVTDVSDPTHDADYLIECLKRNVKTRAIPIVALVHAGQQSAAKASCLKEVSLCVMKHISPKDLIGRIRSLLEGGQTYRIDPDPQQARSVDAVFSELGHHGRVRTPRIMAKMLKSQQQQSEANRD